QPGVTDDGQGRRIVIVAVARGGDRLGEGGMRTILVLVEGSAQRTRLVTEEAHRRSSGSDSCRPHGRQRADHAFSHGIPSSAVIIAPLSRHQQLLWSHGRKRSPAFPEPFPWC